jgi:dihydroneopterin aldolase
MTKLSRIDLPARPGVRVFIRGLMLQTEIGVHPHERGRLQPLVLDVELTLEPAVVAGIGDTVNYEILAQTARDLAAEGHVELVETYAERLAAACLALPRVTAVRVRAEKPQAIPDAAAAGVEVTVTRD